MVSLSDVLRKNTMDANKPTLDIFPGFAKFSIPCLKHKQELELFPIWLDFLDAENLRSTTLTYELHANEIIDPIHGKLHLRIDDK
jgi:hypothetical protein